jgi:putative heme-binding domain-containing protein
LIDAAPRLVPAARRALIEALVRRSDAAPQLLAVTHDGKIPLRDWTVEQMNRMRRHDDPAVRARAEHEFGAVPADRQSVVDRFLPALALTGDPKHGAALFQERCAGCHQFKGQGTALGPDLASVVSNGPEKLLVSILDPNREVAPNFTAWTAESTEGDSVSGLLVSDNDSGVVLRVAGGQETRIPKEKLARLKPEGRSLMPEGLESGLEPQGIADLLAQLLGNGAQ